MDVKVTFWFYSIKSNFEKCNILIAFGCLGYYKTYA